jgi:hypothetical protein
MIFPSGSPGNVSWAETKLPFKTHTPASTLRTTRNRFMKKSLKNEWLKKEDGKTREEMGGTFYKVVLKVAKPQLIIHVNH